MTQGKQKIDVLISYAKKTSKILRQKYNTEEWNQEEDEILTGVVINKIRSCLDKCYHEIVSEIIKPTLDPLNIDDVKISKHKHYTYSSFPYRFKNESEFTTNKVMSRIKKINPRIHRLMRGMQVFHSGDKTIEHLSQLDNGIKHLVQEGLEQKINELSVTTKYSQSVSRKDSSAINDVSNFEIRGAQIDMPIEIINSRNVKINNSNLNSVTSYGTQDLELLNNLFSGIKMDGDMVVEGGVLTKACKDYRIKIKVMHQFKVANLNMDVFDFIDKSIDYVETFCNEVYKEFPQR
jgi:hypothetical protein